MLAIGHLFKLARVGFVLAREGALAIVDPVALPPLARLGLKSVRLIERRGASGSRLAAAMTRLGPSYVKFGQFLATRPDIVGMEVARELELLQDRMAPFPRTEAERIVEGAFDRPLSALFSSFSEAIAAASVAQVHRAERIEADGRTRTVAVKVLRPGVRDRFRGDLETMRFAARQIERFVPSSRRLKPLTVVETLARSVTIEMDLRLEAAALSEFAEKTASDADFHVPAVDWGHTARDVLTTDWVDGIALSDLPAIEAAGHDRAALAASVIQSFLKHAMRDGFFHADMHQGNLFVDAGGRLVAVDCGIMGRLGFKERRFLAEILYGFIMRDYARVARVHFEAGYVPGHQSVDDFAQALRAVGEPIHMRRADEISMAKLLTLLFEITGLFEMATRPELVMLQKTMVVVEGVGRSLDPQLDMWHTAEPVVRAWIERNLGPVGLLEGAARQAGETGKVLQGVPAFLSRVQTITERFEEATRQGLTLVPAPIEPPPALHGWSRAAVVALWLIAFSMIAAWLWPR